MELCTNKQERLIGVLFELKSVNLSESCQLKPRELEIGPYMHSIMLTGLYIGNWQLQSQTLNKYRKLTRKRRIPADSSRPREAQNRVKFLAVKKKSIR